MAHQVHDAELDYGVGEAFQPVDDRDQDILIAPVQQFVHHRETELGAFGRGDPQAQNVTPAIAVDAGVVDAEAYSRTRRRGGLGSIDSRPGGCALCGSRVSLYVG